MVIYLSVEKVFLHKIPVVEKRFWHQHVALEIRNRDLYSSFFVNLLFKIPQKFEPNFWKMFKPSNQSVWLLKCVSNSKLKYHLSVFQLLSSFSGNPQNTPIWVIFDSTRLATANSSEISSPQCRPYSFLLDKTQKIQLEKLGLLW